MNKLKLVLRILLIPAAILSVHTHAYTVHAFEIDKASPSMTVEQSKELYEQKAKEPQSESANVVGEDGGAADYIYDPQYGIIEEADIRVSSQEVQKRKDAETLKGVLIVASLAVIVVTCLILYINRTRIMKTKKRSRKK